jgi:cytochrome c-type biogenesis protein CcmH/NrfG
MSENTQATSREENWSNTQAYTLAVVCLLAGVAGGWLFRGSQPSLATAAAASVSSAPAGAGEASAQPTAEQMKKMAAVSAAPLIEQLKGEPNNPELLVKVGNLYYDAQQFPEAIDYYRRALEIRPADTAVRTDMATAIWYAGDADGAIAEFTRSLSYDSTRANTLFNLGIVKWQGKMDIRGAVAAWQKLLDSNPNYEAKDKVLQLIAEAKKHESVKPGAQAVTLPE